VAQLEGSDHRDPYRGNAIRELEKQLSSFKHFTDCSGHIRFRATLVFWGSARNGTDADSAAWVVLECRRFCDELINNCHKSMMFIHTVSQCSFPNFQLSVGTSPL
jgi:hypothetical protein